MPLHTRIKKVSAFLSQKNLSGKRLTYAPAKTRLALVVIDVQKKFCKASRSGDPETEAVAKRVAKLVPEFRKACVPVYLVHFSAKGKEIDFYKIKPEKSDTLVRKKDVSAFTGSNINAILKKDRRENLLVCGVYLSQCVKETIRDAKSQAYKVALLEDLTEAHEADRPRKNKTLQAMKNNGVLITTSADVLGLLRKKKYSRSSMKR